MLALVFTCKLHLKPIKMINIYNTTVQHYNSSLSAYYLCRVCTGTVAVADTFCHFFSIIIMEVSNHCHVVVTWIWKKCQQHAYSVHFFLSKLNMSELLKYILLKCYKISVTFKECMSDSVTYIVLQLCRRHRNKRID